MSRSRDSTHCCGRWFGRCWSSRWACSRVMLAALAWLVARAQTDINQRTSLIISLRQRLERLVSQSAATAMRTRRSRAWAGRGNRGHAALFGRSWLHQLRRAAATRRGDRLPQPDHRGSGRSHRCTRRRRRQDDRRRRSCPVSRPGQCSAGCRYSLGHAGGDPLVRPAARHRHRPVQWAGGGRIDRQRRPPGLHCRRRQCEQCGAAVRSRSRRRNHRRQ